MTSSDFDALLVSCGLPSSPAVLDAPGLTPEEATRLVAALTAGGVHGRVLEGASLKNKADLLSAVAAAFQFPGHFGNNWDALVDCWSDMVWLPSKGYVGVLLDAAAFRKADAKAHDELVTVCNDVAERWRGREGGMVFHLVRGTAARAAKKSGK